MYYTVCTRSTILVEVALVASDEGRSEERVVDCLVPVTASKLNKVGEREGPRNCRYYPVDLGDPYREPSSARATSRGSTLLLVVQYSQRNSSVLHLPAIRHYYIGI